MTPDKPYEPYNTNAKKKVKRDSEPENYLFYLGNNVMDHVSHYVFFAAHRKLKIEIS